MLCVAVAAVAMPAVAYRAAEQRAAPDSADIDLASLAQDGSFTQITLASARVGEFAYRAHGASVLGHDALGGAANFLRTALAQQQAENALAAAQDIRPRLTTAGLRLNTASAGAREKRCLAEAVYYEARSESYRGQIAVAEVVMNRTRSGVYPRTICGVVYQGSERGPRLLGCQFSFTCDGSLRYRPHGRAWAQANRIASEVLEGGHAPMTGRATHYHTVAIRPYWAPSYVETTRVGAHVFYRMPTAAERRTMRPNTRRWTARDVPVLEETLVPPIDVPAVESPGPVVGPAPTAPAVPAVRAPDAGEAAPSVPTPDAGPEPSVAPAPTDREA